MSIEAGLPLLLGLLLGTVRSATWLMISPPFSTRMIPGQIKAIIAVALALPVAPTLAVDLPELSIAALIGAVVLQAVTGAALGFLTFLLFAAIQAAGDLIDLFGGFTLAMAYDPLSQNQSSLFGRFYNLMAMTLLFATEGHQLVLRGFMQSYEALPLNALFSLETFSRLLVEGVGEMFLAAVQIAGPLIAVLFLTDVAFGLLNRVAPALNAFQLGFPAKIFLVLTLSGTAIATLPAALDALVDQAVSAVVQLTGG